MTEETQEDQSRHFWNAAADDTSRGLVPGMLEEDAEFAAFRDRSEKSTLLRRLGDRLRPNMSLLEIGCGSGRWTVDLAPRVRRLVATDIAPRMIDLARERVRAAGLDNVELQVAPFEETRYDRRFDFVYLGCCLQYMSDEAIAVALERLAANTTPDCPLLSRDTVSTLDRRFHRSERYANDDPAIYRTADEYAAVMARHGWQAIDSWPTWVKPWAWKIVGHMPRVVRGAWLRLALWLTPLALRLSRPGDKQHRFFLYERRETPPT
jgi:SAM-dependent methyltransferase